VDRPASAELRVLKRFRVVELSPGARLPLLQTTVQERVAGGRIYDAHIAEVARQAGTSVVVTDNLRHFSGLVRQGLRLLDSAAFAAELRR